MGRSVSSVETRFIFNKGSAKLGTPRAMSQMSTPAISLFFPPRSRGSRQPRNSSLAILTLSISLIIFHGPSASSMQGTPHSRATYFAPL